MSVDIKHMEEGRVLYISISGQLHKEDYQQMVPVIEAAMGQHNKIRLLVQMTDFHGWDAGALWQDIKFDAKHFKDIESLALVGDKRWEKGMSIFCNPFTTAKIKYFDVKDLNQAQLWIAEELKAPSS